MSIIRVVKNTQYTVINNLLLQDKRLSLKARGLLAYCLSLPENWNYSIQGFVKSIGSDGRDSIRAGLKELEDCGYLKRRRLHDATGKFTDTEYIIYETAQMADEEKEDMQINSVVETEESITENSVLENSTLGKPASENPALENRLQQNKYIQNKYKTTTTATMKKHMEPNNAVHDELNDLAKRCCVSEKIVCIACKKFGTETVRQRLVYMARQQGIQKPNVWLMQSLRESWDINPNPGNQPSPDCLECKGMGYTLFYYEDPQTATRREMRLNCSKCCDN